MKRLMFAAIAALMLLTAPARAAEPDCQVSGVGHITKGASMVKNFAKLGLSKLSDVKIMLSYSSAAPTGFADIVEIWRAMGCAVEDPKAVHLRQRWAKAIDTSYDAFNTTEAYAYYVDVAWNVRAHLSYQTLSPAELQLLADTAAWAQATGNRRFAHTLQGLTQALGLPPPGR